jgi:hypothetical protein
MDIPRIMLRKLTKATSMWIVPVVDCDQTSAGLSMRSVGKIATRTAHALEIATRKQAEERPPSAFG